MVHSSDAVALHDSDLTGEVIGAAIEVHRVLGPGYLERVYENALCVELEERGVAFERQHQAPVMYKGTEVGLHQLDLLVEDRVVVELKAVKAFEAVHFATLRSYLRALSLRDGLLLNFSLLRLQVKRASGLRVAPG